VSLPSTGAVTIAALVAGVFAAALLPTLVLNSPSSSRAAFPGTNGRMVFSTIFFGGDKEIWSINPDGSDLQQLTTDPAQDVEPAVSADGLKIAFVSRRDGDDEVFVMNLDGSGQTQLTHNEVRDREPAWSPDGTKIAWTSDGLGGVAVMNADGSNPVLLAEGDGPAWSPDCAKIAYLADGHVRLMDANGSGQTVIADDQFYRDLNWSPDGTRIVVSSIPADTNIWTMKTDGSEKTNITAGEEHGFRDQLYPSWSPDGAKIAYTENFNILVMDANGANPVNVTTSDDDFEEDADWGPLPAGPTSCPGSSASPTPTATPLHAIQGDDDCDGDVDSIDSLQGLLHIARLPVFQNQPCPAIGSEFASIFGDVDCDTDVDAIDSLGILRFVARLPSLPVPPDCPAIGDPLQTSP